MKKSLNKILIKGLKFHSHHGVKPEEKAIGGTYEVDVELFYDATDAIIKDDLSHALNYEEILFDITDFMQSEPFDLIETLTFEILKHLMDKYPIIEKVTVKVRKYNIPFKGLMDYIETEQTFERIQKN